MMAANACLQDRVPHYFVDATDEKMRFAPTKGRAKSNFGTENQYTRRVGPAVIVSWAQVECFEAVSDFEKGSALGVWK